MGSTFHVYLPLHQTMESSPNSAAPSVEEARLALTALIVDDEPFAIENFRFTLEPLGCTVVGVRDPRALDGALAEHQPDLLFIDVVMPHISGLQVLRELGKRPNMPPIVITSAHPGNEQIARALGAEWLAKPWKSSALQQLVVRLCPKGVHSAKPQLTHVSAA
jgi:CheY-like chemotaxis protein